MSKIVESQVWKSSPSSGSKLLVLLSIADQSDDGGWAYPGHNNIAKRARISRRHAQKLLDQLEAEGELVIYNRRHDNAPAQHYSNVYHLAPYGEPNASPPLDLRGELVRRIDPTSPALPSVTDDTTPLVSPETLPSVTDDTTPLSPATLPDVTGDTRVVSPETHDPLQESIPDPAPIDPPQEPASDSQSPETAGAVETDDSTPVQNLDVEPPKPTPEEIGQVMKLVDENIQVLTARVSEMILDMLDVYGVDALKTAIREAVLANIPKLAYIEAVAKRVHHEAGGSGGTNYFNGKYGSYVQH